MTKAQQCWHQELGGMGHQPLAEANLGLGNVQPNSQGLVQAGTRAPGWVIQEENVQAGKSPNIAVKCSLS